MTNIGHWGMGDLEVVLRKSRDFEKAKPLIERAYQENQIRPGVAFASWR
ncbi:MAG: hypothetical protein RBS40_13980 [Rhodocyclaceae bacterium]|jgi:predicted transport protein|nr:hypothetical protein [Rhodocyclaceae bacterium]